MFYVIASPDSLQLLEASAFANICNAIVEEPNREPQMDHQAGRGQIGHGPSQQTFDPCSRESDLESANAACVPHLRAPPAAARCERSR